MRIFIITMDDPIITNIFLKKVIKSRSSDIVGLASTKQGRTEVYKKSRLEYLINLFIILGPYRFTINVLKTLVFKIDSFFSFILGRDSRLSIIYFSKRLKIPTFKNVNVNQSSFLKKVRNAKPDIIINQSQSILKSDLLSIPRIGTINRHNALLPRHKGRISPFWVLLNKDKETGVSIHFVDEGIDEGEIIFQFKYKVSNFSFNDLVDINYRIAPFAMLKAINILESGLDFSKTYSSKSNYNSTPRFKDVVDFLKLKYA